MKYWLEKLWLSEEWNYYSLYYLSSLLIYLFMKELVKENTWS